MQWHIRLAQEEELPAILAILKAWNMHHIPSVEMEAIDFTRFYVAVIDEEVVGVSGYKMLTPLEAKTTLLAVHPKLQRTGLGKELHICRLEAMWQEGAQSVITNADRIETIVWYKKHFNYKEIGRIAKEISFGDDTVSYWTTLKMDLHHYMHNRDKAEQRKVHFINNHEPVPLAAYEPLIINACITGVVPTKLHTPYVPLTDEEIVQEAVSLYGAGVSIVHLHVRDAEGNAILDAERYASIVANIRTSCPDMICCISTSGRGGVDIRQRADVLAIEGKGKPDMASLTLGSVNFIDGTSVTRNDEVQYLAQIMQERGIKPEIEIFDSGMFNLLQYMMRYHIISDPLYINVMTGNINGLRADLETLAFVKTRIPDNATWAVGALGTFEMPMHMLAIASGAHVRVGLEDTLYYDINKEHLATNLSLVERITHTASLLGREIASASWTRKKLGL